MSKPQQKWKCPKCLRVFTQPLMVTGIWCAEKHPTATCRKVTDEQAKGGEAA